MNVRDLARGLDEHRGNVDRSAAAELGQANDERDVCSLFRGLGFDLLRKDDGKLVGACRARSSGSPDEPPSSCAGVG
jgi:hypothetical protein